MFLACQQGHPRRRAPRRGRVIDAVPHGHWKSTRRIASLDLDGMRCSLVLDGPVNGAAFDAFVEKLLVPELRPGEIVVTDNLSSHKGVRIAQHIRAAGAELL